MFLLLLDIKWQKCVTSTKFPRSDLEKSYISDCTDDLGVAEEDDHERQDEAKDVDVGDIFNLKIDM